MVDVVDVAEIRDNRLLINWKRFGYNNWL